MEMDDKTKNAMLFYLVCIPARLLIAYGLFYVFEHDLKLPYRAPAYYLGFLALIGLGLIIADIRRRFFGAKKEGFFGSEVYWYGSVHGLMYLLAAFSAFRGDVPTGVKILLLDVAIGLATRLFLK